MMVQHYYLKQTRRHSKSSLEFVHSALTIIYAAIGEGIGLNDSTD